MWLGKYRLIATLGRGGMADVNLAMARGPAGSRFAKLAVVKRLRVGVADDPEFVTMLVDEARITANLNHPNVVQMFEVGVEEGRPFLAMEYLDGLSLRRVRQRGAKAGVPRAIDCVIVADMLAGLHHAHELTSYSGTKLSIVHRDVSPHNVFITVDGQVKVLDFGIAKALGSSAVTQQGMVKGKLRYMSPEQARGIALDRRSDIFSVGIVLWEAVTRRRFWDQYPDSEWVGRSLITGKYQASPRAVDPTIPEGLDAICRKALALDPDHRYATAEEFRSDLESFLGDAEIVRARRQLGPLIAELSKKERTLIRTIIEEAASADDLVTQRPAGGALGGEGPLSTRKLPSSRPSIGTDPLRPVSLSLQSDSNGPPAPGGSEEAVRPSGVLSSPHAGRTVLMPKVLDAPNEPNEPRPGRTVRRWTELALGALGALALVGAGVLVSVHLGRDHGSTSPKRERSELTDGRCALSLESDTLKYDRPSPTDVEVVKPSSTSRIMPPSPSKSSKRRPPSQAPSSSTSEHGGKGGR